MTADKIAFISGGDANYYAILCEWVHSVRRFKQSEGIDICIMDVGLEPAQVQKLEQAGCHVVKPDWPFRVPESKIRGREYLKACICRPSIPKIFPGYDLYVWMDGDTWIQDWRGVELYIKGAQRGKLTITGQVDRGYFKQVRVKWLGSLPLKIRGFYMSNALKAFGFKTAQKLMPYHVLNAGAFSMAGDAPHWARWQELVEQACKKGKIFTAEQLTLGMMVYLEDYPAEILPAWTQWLCENKPLWDEDKQSFVENFLPHEEISIVHISGYDEMRKNRTVSIDAKTIDGKDKRLSFRYPYYDGEAECELDPPVFSPVSDKAA